MTMDDKDRQLQQLFDDYANELPERHDLASKARAQMTEKNGKRYERETRRISARAKRRTVIITVSSLAAAAAVGVFAFGVLPKMLVGGSNSGTPPATDGDASLVGITRYSLDEVRAVSVSAEFAKSYIDLDELRAQSDVFDEHYYACYIENKEDPVYVRAVFGVGTTNGTTEMSVIAERDGYRRNDLQKSYGGLITPSGYYMYYNDYDRGEYVTAAYFAARGYNYYVYAQSGAGFANDLIENLL